MLRDLFEMSLACVPKLIALMRRLSVVAASAMLQLLGEMGASER